MIFDLHNDLLTSGAPYTARYFSVPRRVVLAVWTTRMKLDVPTLSVLLSDAKARLSAVRPKLDFAVEDLGFLTDAEIARFTRLPLLYAGLTWNGENRFAGGAESDGGLTAAGKGMIRSLEKAGIVLDTAHLNETSFYAAADASSKPLLCSHAAFYGPRAHCRNLKDAQLRRIVDSEGLAGLCAVGPFLSESGDASRADFVRHIGYFLDRFGDQNLAVGTDFHGTSDLPQGLKTYRNFHRLAADLSAKGVSDASIENIFYRNAERFFQKTRSLYI
ncbi:hypothetical protein FACS1894211_16190 [Clostridia bacterium]|nr:hypothetical protein FACS1894211_16190 [Clostridia bacterium]